ncbi:MAG: type II toxin-antitoxin system PemK/MazF family toxin [Clostridia bacterium]|nr:type II toxin-antitoxin system PemK/MazF family toxin [Clostridia bacterium]
MMSFDGEGSEQGGLRPGIVFQNNVGNAHSPNLIALPLTTAIKKINLPTHVYLPAKDTGLLRDSIVLCENPQRMSKSRLGKYIAHLPDSYMKQVAVANLVATSAISFLDIETLIKTWESSVRLNAS